MREEGAVPGLGWIVDDRDPGRHAVARIRGQVVPLAHVEERICYFIFQLEGREPSEVIR
jgi:hypothetical protein